MKTLLETLFHTEVKEKNFDKKILPLYLKGDYDIKVYSLNGQDILFVGTREQVAFNSLKKHWMKFQELTGMKCVIYGEQYSQYGKQRMIELGIPFIFGADNVYLPDMGILLKKTHTTELPDIEHFSPFTQRLILAAIYGKWKEKSTKEISEMLGVSRITANRALIELQALQLPLTVITGKTRYYRTEKEPKGVFEICEPFFISPIAKTYRLGEIPDGLHMLGGMTALEHYSMIGDNSYRTFAVNRDEAKKIEFERYHKVPRNDTPVCLVQVLRYKVQRENFVDPITAILSLTDKEKAEARVEIAIEEALKGVWNGKRD